MSKRPADDGEPGSSRYPSPPPTKYQKIQFQPLNLGPISTLEEMDVKTLRFQNKKLALKLEQRERNEVLLRQRIEQLEKRQTQDDTLLNVVNRYWNQLNEDIRILLQRFDSEATDEGDDEKGPSASFLTQLATWDCQELEKKLAQRVQTSQRAVAKILQAFDHLLLRQERLNAALKELQSTSTSDEEEDEDEEKQTTADAAQDQDKAESPANEKEKDKGDDKDEKTETPKKSNGKKSEPAAGDEEEDEKKEEETSAPPEDDEARRRRKKEQLKRQMREKEKEKEREKRRKLMTKRPRKDGDNEEVDAEEAEKRKSRERKDREKDREKEKRRRRSRSIKFDEVLKKELEECQAQVKRLNDLNVQLHQQHHTMSLKLAEVQEKIAEEETAREELRNRLDEWMYECNNAQGRCVKLESILSETMEKLKIFEAEHEEKVRQDPKSGASLKNLTNLSQKKVEELQRDVEEQRELASSRLAELEKLHQSHKEALQDVESLKMDIKHLPESIIVETVEYKCLQSQYSVLYNEFAKVQTQLEEARVQLMNSKAESLRNIEQMESEELICQKKLRTEMIELEDVVAQLRKEYEMLRMQFEKNLVTHEQTQPINKEMRNLIQSLQIHNQQLKGEVNRYKKKCKDLQVDVERLQKDLEKSIAAQPAVKKEENVAAGTKAEGETEQGGKVEVKAEPEVKTEGNEGADPAAVKAEPEVKPDETASAGTTPAPKREGTPAQDVKETPVGKKKPMTGKSGPQSSKADLEAIRELKFQLKKAQNEQKEMKLLLDMYKGAAKEQRDKVQLMAAERKARMEIEEMKQQLKKLQDAKLDERKRMSEEEALRKIAKLEDEKRQLTKNVAAHKSEIEAIINEMEVTGQAFEDMQEQNARLIQQMREKDDANFKLMADRIKFNQVNKLAREERQMLNEQVNNLSTQLEAQAEVLRKLEEKDRLLSAQVGCLDKESHVKQQTLDHYRRKAVEAAQAAADLKLHLEKYHAQVKEAQQMLAEKTGALEQEGYRLKRAQEDIATLKRKLERAKKLEQAGTADEVLLEEIREYREQLTCPSCQVKKKDAVLTKCFHVFCFDCIRTRYETRQRKCPKCNAAFGANDYHRLYLS